MTERVALLLFFFYLPRVPIKLLVPGCCDSLRHNPVSTGAETKPNGYCPCARVVHLSVDLEGWHSLGVLFLSRESGRKPEFLARGKSGKRKILRVTFAGLASLLITKLTTRF
jgi:hypothetical protein